MIQKGELFCLYTQKRNYTRDVPFIFFCNQIQSKKENPYEIVKKFKAKKRTRLEGSIFNRRCTTANIFVVTRLHTHTQHPSSKSAYFRILLSFNTRGFLVNSIDYVFGAFACVNTTPPRTGGKPSMRQQHQMISAAVPLARKHHFQVISWSSSCPLLCL